MKKILVYINLSIFFSKKDISTPLVKNKITEYFKKLSDKINPPDLKIQKYYLYVIESLNKQK